LAVLLTHLKRYAEAENHIKGAGTGFKFKYYFILTPRKPIAAFARA
jgi:hypothetical protein